MYSTEILNWLKVGYEKADSGSAPGLVMGIAGAQEDRGFLRVIKTIVNMAKHGSILCGFTRSLILVSDELIWRNQ